MFSLEYASSSENRYRFAWIVATVDPIVRADNVDDDIVLLARRALDKNWQRRRLLRLDDFLIDNDSGKLGLAAIGLTPSMRPVLDTRPGVQPGVARDLAKKIESSVLDHLKNFGLQVTHTTNVNGSDRDWRVMWRWKVTGDFSAEEVHLFADISLVERDSGVFVENRVEIIMAIDSVERTADMSLPHVALVEGVEDDLARQIVASLGGLSSTALAARQGER